MRRGDSKSKFVLDYLHSLFNIQVFFFLSVFFLHFQFSSMYQVLFLQVKIVVGLFMMNQNNQVQELHKI